MAFAVNIYFDPSTESHIKRYWKMLDDAGLPNLNQRAFRPHITLCIFDQIDCEDCECYINEISSEFILHSVTLDHLGIFNVGEKVLFLGPTPNRRLLTMQGEVFETLSGFASKPWELYHPNAWVPHCTLANDLDEDSLIKALEIAIKIELPIQAEISQIGIIEFDPIQTIFQFNIKE
jgi:2'-5' RNA ligase